MFAKNLYEDYRKQADKHIPEMMKILRENAIYFMDIEIADDYKDAKESTDLIVSVKGGADVAVRTRFASCQFRDFTIRSRSFCGGETEIHKLRKGFAKWYLYAWELNNGLYEWILVDLDKVRQSNLLVCNSAEMQNADGKTRFVAIPLKKLWDAGAIVNLRLTQDTRSKSGLIEAKQKKVC